MCVSITATTSECVCVCVSLNALWGYHKCPFHDAAVRDVLFCTGSRQQTKCIYEFHIIRLFFFLLCPNISTNLARHINTHTHTIITVIVRNLTFQSFVAHIYDTHVCSFGSACVVYGAAKWIERMTGSGERRRVVRHLNS